MCITIDLAATLPTSLFIFMSAGFELFHSAKYIEMISINIGRKEFFRPHEWNKWNECYYTKTYYVLNFIQWNALGHAHSFDYMIK